MNKITLNNRDVYYSDIKKGLIVGETQNEELAIDFIKDWLNDKTEFIVNTSGSTGKPKPIRIPREKMVISAQKTIKFLGLDAGDSSLLCLSTNTIAGKMMIVRSIIGQLSLKIIDPTSKPFEHSQQAFDFVALVPLQVQNSLNSPHFKNTKNVIIGGAPLEENLRKELLLLSNNIYQSYGMTETISHIALKKVIEDSYTILDGVKINTNKDKCLVIEAPMAITSPLQTNDIVEIINSKQFKWLGRKDNVINSGGIKIHPEQLEKEILTALPHLEEVIVYGEENNEYGQSIALISKRIPIKSEEGVYLKETLPKHHCPRKFYSLDDFVYKESGKLDRNSTIALINKN